MSEACSFLTEHRSPCVVELLSEMDLITSLGLQYDRAFPPPSGQSMPISHMKQLTVCCYYTTNFIPVVTRPRFGALELQLQCISLKCCSERDKDPMVLRIKEDDSVLLGNCSLSHVRITL